MLRATALIVAVVVSALGSVASSSDATDAFFPADPTKVAIVSNGRRMAVTDGRSTIDLGVIPGADIPADDFDTFSVNAEGSLIALAASDYEGHAELAVINLTDGSVTQKKCSVCDGVAVIDGHVVSYGRDNLRIYDARLNLERNVPVAVTNPRPFDSPGGALSARLQGTAAGALVFVSAWAQDSRSGPMAVSLYTLDGVLRHNWIIDRLVWSADATSADGRFIALTVGGSGGVCLGVAVPMVIDTQQEEPIALVPHPFHERADGTTYFTGDLWWNGTEVVTVGRFQGRIGNSSKCISVGAVRRFDFDGELASIQTERVVRNGEALVGGQYRFLGDGCGRSLRTDVARHGRLYYFDDDGKRNRIRRGYDAIVWAAPRNETCERFPGLSGLNAPSATQRPG